MIVVAPGVNTLLMPEDVDAARDAIVEADILLVELESPMETVERAIRVAHEAGVRVLLNPAPGQPLDAAMLAMVDVLTPNETEAEIITGRSIRSVDEAEAAARQLLDTGVGIAIITLGVNGALLVTKDDAQHVPGHKVDVVDTTGAGDAFNGALAVALAEGQPLADAVAFANVAAALQVTKLGTAPAMPYRADVEAVLEA